MAYTTIDNPELYFQAKNYSGNASTNAITLDGSEDMQPDMVWLKSRSFSQNHELYDAVRGVTKRLYPNGTYVEDTNSTGVTAFNSDGFTLGSSNAINKNGETFASWNWKAGTSFTNDASSTSIGTIDSTGSASSDAGFSIVSYTGNGTSGATVKHGLSTALDVIFIKNRDESEAWQTYHRPLGATHHLVLNGTDSAQDNDSRFNDVHPTSSVFTLGNNDTVNKNTVKFIAYCFHSVKGYSKFGSYTGNNNSNGTFVYLGFKPAFVMFKNTTGNNWGIIDNKRDPYNGALHRLIPNTSGADNTGAGVVIDFLSNGFKCRNSDGLENGAAEIIYMAFAENPFVNSNGVPTNAR